MRHLAIAQVRVPKERRPAFVDELRRRRDAAREAGQRFWVFASAADDEAFVEFTEGDDPARLTTSGGSLYTEVELD